MDKYILEGAMVLESLKFYEHTSNAVIIKDV